MHPNIRAVLAALEELGVSFSPILGFPDAVMVGSSAFIRAATPFNNGSASLVCRDKAAVHALLHGKIKMPKTISFKDPHEQVSPGRFADILNMSLDIFYPRIVKMNHGERGKNVFIARDDNETVLALDSIFDPASKEYDYIALIQEFIEPAREIRIVVVNGGCALAYYREKFESVSPDEFSLLSSFSRPILDTIDLSWGAIDVIQSRNGTYYFIEVNTKPSFEGLIAARGIALAKGFYIQALSAFLHDKKAGISNSTGDTRRSCADASSHLSI